MATYYMKSTPPKLETVLPILQGLLASGHYMSFDEYGAPELRTHDVGEDFHSDGFARRYVSDAISQAIDMARELEDQMEIMSAE